MKEKVEVDGVITWVQKMHRAERSYNIRKRYGSIDICPICREKMGPNIDVFILINNYVLFPNIQIHAECARGDLISTIMFLRDDFKHAKEMKEYNRCWFD